MLSYVDSDEGANKATWTVLRSTRGIHAALSATDPGRLEIWADKVATTVAIPSVTIRLFDGDNPSLHTDYTIPIDITETNLAPQLVNPGTRTLEVGEQLSMQLRTVDLDIAVQTSVTD